jgi:hypothetical protein
MAHVFTLLMAEKITIQVFNNWRQIYIEVTGVTNKNLYFQFTCTHIKMLGAIMFGYQILYFLAIIKMENWEKGVFQMINWRELKMHQICDADATKKQSLIMGD